MNDSLERMTELVNGPPWCEFFCGVVDGLNDTAVVEPEGEREVEY